MAGLRISPDCLVPEGEPASPDSGFPPDALNDVQSQALAAELAWLDFRTRFEQHMGQFDTPMLQFRNVFECDSICLLIVSRWLEGKPTTLKELATYFARFCTEVTIKRQLDELEIGGLITRQTDATDRRRQLLVPTGNLAEVGRLYLQARIDTALAHGFVYDPERAAEQIAAKRTTAGR